jgi:hypothetical protein
MMQRSLNAVSIRLRPATASAFQPWTRLAPLPFVEPDPDVNPVVPMILFVSTAAIGMIPRSFWRAFPTLIRRYRQQASKAASAITSTNPDDDQSDEEEEED